MDTVNWVVELNEYAQRTDSRLHFEDHGSIGPHHDATFTQRVVLNGKVYPDGVGKNKKEAKHNAAKNALKCLLENEHQDSTENTAEASTAPDHQTSVSNINYICWLNEYGQKNRVTIRAVESTRLGQNNATPCCSFVVGDQEYPAVTGETKREAKEEAAKLVYNVICGRKTAETADEKHNCTSGEKKEELTENVLEICNKTRPPSWMQLYRDKRRQTETNYIGIVNHYCQKTNRFHTYIEERRCGPPHERQFFYKLIIDNKEYPVGEGKSIKEAKQNAAQLAWSALQEQSDWDSKVSFRSTVSEDGASPVLSVQSLTLESHGSSPQSTSMSTSSSVIFTDSNAQTTSAEDAPTRLSTPTSPESLLSSQSMSTGTSGSGIFTDSTNSSKDQDAVEERNMGTTQTETSAQSKFTSDFDPMECLGRGAFGCVYKVKHKLLENHYAVKIVRRGEKSLREVRTLSDLNHPNIVRYYTFWMENSGYQWKISSDSYRSTDNSSSKFLYIQMELCDTKTLKDWIDEKNTRSLQDFKRREESLNIAQQIVCGVQHIHFKKHIHRDLKPENILFGLDGEVKIGDFGLVTRDDDDGSAAMERTGCRGTTTYMAPEQLSEKTYDRKVDIFPLGLIYFELLWKLSTGHERGKIWDDARSQKLPEEFSLNFPQENQMIESMLCEKPEGRPEASTLKAELKKLTQTFNVQNILHENVTL